MSGPLSSRQHQPDFVVGDVGRTEVLDGGRAVGGTYLADDVGDNELVFAGDEIIEIHLAAIDVAHQMTDDGAKGKVPLMGDVRRRLVLTVEGETHLPRLGFYFFGGIQAP